ncbi:MAG TPA: hypothetical protein PLT07_12285 [Trueperaceae bacterium]|nr:hypothetical protein [Trueperaceae bacterium]
MRHTSSKSGIAIVSVLLILAAIMMMGIAGMFLTQMNLGITRNVRSSGVAQNAAYTGLSAAYVTLQGQYEANGALPNSLSLPSTQGRDYQPAYELKDYRASGQTAFISVAGSAGNDSEYVAEALIQFVGGSSLPPFFAYGLSSEGIVSASGNASYVNAGIHGNKGFTMSGNQYFYLCTRRNAKGECTKQQQVASDSIPISGSPGADTCRVSGNPGDYKVCEKGVPVNLTDPVTIVPGFAERFPEALAAVSNGSLVSRVLGINCDYVFSSTPSQATFTSAIAGLVPGATVCVEGAADLSFSGSGYSLDNINLVLRNSVSFSGNYSTKNLTIISTEGTVRGSGNSDFESMRVFAAGDIRFSGNHDIVGRSTFASGEDLTVSGNAAAVTSASGDPAVGVVYIAEGDIKVSGNSKLYIAAIAGGAFTKSGNAKLTGRIASKGNLTISGNFDIDSGFGLDNDDLVEGGPPMLKVVSVR